MTQLTWRTVAVPLLLVAGLGLTACAGGASDNATPAAADAPADGSALASAAEAADGSGRSTGGLGSMARQEAAIAVQQRAVIQTGSVSLHCPDVADARFELEKLVDRHGGQIDDERTATDQDGTIARSRIVIRVPSREFDDAMTELGRLGILVEATRKAEDVTTQVIDVAARIKAQAASVERVEALLSRAQSIGDVVAIEAQLTRRQAELDALRQTQAYLADQTSMSTISVHLERSTDQPPTAPAEDHTAFVAGLIAGWDAFTDVAGGLAKATGAALPFLGVLLLLAWPALLLVRRFASTRPAPEATPTEA